MSDSQEEVKSYKEVLTTIRARVMGALKPPARLDVSEWADSHVHCRTGSLESWKICSSVTRGAYRLI